MHPPNPKKLKLSYWSPIPIGEKEVRFSVVLFILEF